MLFPNSKRAPVPGFKICFNDSSDAEHRIFHIDIKDVRKWRDAFKPERLDNKTERRRQDTRASMAQWAITNSSFVTCNQEDIPITVREPESTDSESSYDSLIFTTEKLDVFGNTKYNGTVDAKMVAERIKTKRILEGTLTPDPDRNYEGEFTLLFLSFVAKEEETQNGNNSLILLMMVRKGGNFCMALSPRGRAMSPVNFLLTIPANKHLSFFGNSGGLSWLPVLDETLMLAATRNS
ncbi:hypothetical protein FocnCong_v018273 [Fusarium oxysporum f. sp. conglutinans]|nr:hypothetical protein FocnCong_v018273 [Fusarium oxysporum f. sp. conglutinans]